METFLVEPDEMQQIIADEGLQEYLPEHGTRPHTLYKNLHRFTRNFITAGVLVDGDCHEGASVTLSSGAGVVGTQTTNFFGEFKFDGLENGEYRVDVDAGGKLHRAGVTIADESQNLGFIEL